MHTFSWLDRGNSFLPQAHMAPSSHSIITGIGGMRGMLCVRIHMHWRDFKYIHARVNFERGRKGCGCQRDKETKWESEGETRMHTKTQMCYWMCKNQWSASKAFPLLVLGVRLPSVAFNYSLSPRPGEPHWFSFSPPPEEQTNREAGSEYTEEHRLGSQA